MNLSGEQDATLAGVGRVRPKAVERFSSFSTNKNESNNIIKVKISLKTLALALAFIVNLSPPAFSQIMMSSDAESELSHKIKPPSEVVELILQSESDDAGQFKECMLNDGEEKIPAADFFSAEQIRLNSDKLPDYFVRPAISPYCGAFYGAHLFRYWFVVGYRKEGKINYRIVFKSGGDEVRVLSRITNGYHDLELVGHNAIKVETSTWRFDGKKYVVAGCSIRAVDPEDSRISLC